MSTFGFIDETAGGAGAAAAAAEAAAAAAATGAWAAAQAAQAVLPDLMPPAGTDLGQFWRNVATDAASQFWGSLNDAMRKPEDTTGGAWSGAFDVRVTPGKVMKIDWLNPSAVRNGTEYSTNCGRTWTDTSQGKSVSNVASIQGIVANPMNAVGYKCGPKRLGLRVNLTYQSGATGTVDFWHCFSGGSDVWTDIQYGTMRIRNQDGTAGSDDPYRQLRPQPIPPLPRERPLLPPPVFPEPAEPETQPEYEPQQPPDRKPAPPIAPPETPPSEQPPPAKQPQQPPIRPEVPKPQPPGPVRDQNKNKTGQGTGQGQGQGQGEGTGNQTPILPDGTPGTQPQPGPETTPKETTVVDNLLIPGPSLSPRPTLEGIAQEVGKIERKTEELLRKKPEEPQWDDILSLLNDILELLSSDYVGGDYELRGICEPTGEGPQPIRRATWGGGSGTLSLLSAKLDALAELLQHHKELRQPICRQKASGEEVTVIFEEI